MRSAIPATRHRNSRTDILTVESASVLVDRAVEAVWLTAAVLVPLIVLSEHDFMSFTDLPKTATLRVLAGLAAVLMLAEGIMSIAQGRQTRLVARPSQIIPRGRAWISAHPGRPVMGAVLLLAVVTAVSTALSISPSMSVWGVEPGGSGNGLYNVAAFLTLFTAVAWKLRTEGQAVRLAVAIAAAGLLAASIGVAQMFGLAPFGIAGTMGTRSTGPSGNPIFFGALLTLTMPLALALLTARRKAGWPLWAAMAAGSYMFMLAALVSSSRGPWLGMAAAMAVFIVASGWTSGRGTAAKTVLAVSIGLVGAWSTVYPPGFLSVAPRPDSTGAVTEALDAWATTSGSLDQRATVAHATFSVNERLERWNISLGIAAGRPETPVGNNLPRLVRVIFGYGPDTFRDVFQMGASAYLTGWITTAAHNDFVNRLVEIGIAGFAAWLAVWAAAAFALIRIGLRRRLSPLHGALAAGTAAALAGRFVEQQSGIPQVGDMTIFWLLLGLLVALSGLASRNSEAIRPAARLARPPSFAAAAPAALMASAMVLILIVTWIKNVDYMRADALAASAVAVQQSDPALALERLERASALAPDVMWYHHRRAAILRGLAEVAPDAFERRRLVARAHEDNLRALAAAPRSRNAHFVAAESAWALAQLGEPERALETIALYEQLAVLAPQHPEVLPRLNRLYEAVQLEHAPD